MPNCHDIGARNDRHEILTWLSPLEPHIRHHDIQTSRVKGVGDWLLRTKEFRGWQSGDFQGEWQKATIFCSGNLGVGKTYISSLVIDTLCDEAGEAGGDIALACFYFDSMAQKEQSAASVLGALLKQVVGGFRKIPKEITDAFQRHKKFIGGRKLQLPEIVKMLGIFSSRQPTFFCLDAVDECAAPDRAKILLSLRDIVEMSPTTRVFLTGRPHVSSEVGKYLAEAVTLVSINPQEDEVIQYIYTKLEEDTTSEAMDERLEGEIVKKLLGAFSKIFLLVALSLDSILQETTIHRRRERLGLRVLTDGLSLGDAYRTTLDRIKAQDGQKSGLGMTALVWICYSERPLRTEELCQALGVEIGSTDCNGDNAPSIQTLLSCCQGFVMVDKEGSIVRLVHYTLREYLTSNRSFFPSTHSTIAETCLTYLNSHQVMALSNLWAQCAHLSPFLEYSSLYWGVHMKKELTECGKALALKLFSRYEYHISIRLLLEHTLGRHPLDSIVNFRKFTGLHCASIFGLVEVLRTLTVMDCVDINIMDETGSTPFLWTAISGHEEALQLLLGRGDVDPNKPDGRGRTPILWAARNGHDEVVKLLLKRKEVNPDKPDMWGLTPILQASGKGHEAIVKLLLGRREVKPDRPGHIFPTALSRAAENGHEGVVRLLLGRRDVKPDRPNKWNQTPILRAAENGHEAVVKLLLGRKDVNPDRLDKHDRTPISLAAGNGHEAVVELLLGRKNINPDRPDKYGRAPISQAAGNGCEAVVKLLLEHGDVLADRPDRWNRTPTSWAAENGHESVVKLLLGREGVSPDRLDFVNRTPISWAAGCGREAVVRLLLGRRDVNPNRPDYNGQTPILRAAGNGYEAVVKLLLERKDVNPWRPDRRGRTPMSLATVNGHVAVVALLQKREGANSDKPYI